MYRIHVHNLDDLVMSILPYHETNMFARVVHTLHLKYVLSVSFFTTRSSKWEFLQNVKESGLPLSRQTLVQRCVSDWTILSFINDGVQQYFQADCLYKTMTSFYGLLVTQVVNKKLDDNMLAAILPFIFVGIQSKQPEYQV